MKNDIIQTYQINNEKSFLIDDPAAYKIDVTQDIFLKLLSII